MTQERSLIQDRSVLRAAWQYRLLVVGLVIIFAIGALLVSMALPPSYVARASILLESPAQQAILSEVPTASERIIQNQLEVFRSTAVAERAVQLADAEGTSISLSQLLDGIETTNVADTDMISVSFSGNSEQDALTVTSAMLDAYVEVRTEQQIQEADRVVQRLDSAEAALREDLAAIQSDIEAASAEHDFNTGINQLLTELTLIESQLSGGNLGANQRERLLERQAEIDVRLRTLQLAKEVEDENAELAQLNDSRNALFDRIEAIDLERSEVEIQAQTAGTGIAFIDEAEITNVNEGAGGFFTLGIGAFLGLLVALGWSYSLAQRRTTFEDRRQPEAILDVPLLGDIPRFGRHISGSNLPVTSDPRSPLSEAFRFAANGIELALARHEGKGVVFLSNVAGQGKTLLIANTALAASREGKKVLVMDADFGNQELTRILLGKADGPGLTEVAAEQAMLREAVQVLDVPGFGTVDVLQRGQLEDVAPEFFERESVKKVFRDLMWRYDLVLVDVPPMMQVAYTSTIAKLVEHGVLVIRKGADLDSARDLLRRARFIDVEVIGYLYNAGVSDHGRPLMGSLRNVLGDRGTGTADTRAGSESIE
jgi:Mrp family chromosome partitioning ATPase/capsular polysaccharide biosynthesis protein